MRPLLALFTAAFLSTSPVSAQESGCPPPSVAQQVRKALPAIPDTSEVIAIDTQAWQNHCRAGPEQPRPLICTGGPGKKLKIADVQKIDAGLRMQFTYMDDFIRTGRGDVWQSGVTCGDCEDYALTLAGRLHSAGAAGETMWLMLWSPYRGAAHATLLVDTADAGLVEIGVGKTETVTRYDASKGQRFATIRFDGRARLTPMWGYSVNARMVWRH